MALEFKLPDIGEGIAEGEIVQWLVAAGDTVEEHQPVVEVMTDKATVEIPAPASGKIGELRAAPGDVVPVGDVIYTLETSGAPAPAPEPVAAAAPAAAAPATANAPAPAPAAAGRMGQRREPGEPGEPAAVGCPPSGHHYRRRATV